MIVSSRIIEITILMTFTLLTEEENFGEIQRPTLSMELEVPIIKPHILPNLIGTYSERAIPKPLCENFLAFVNYGDYHFQF
jgi:hypothetical protein